jgi:nitrite reductase/ring-hydroxylating ferredoxin subunit
MRKISAAADVPPGTVVGFDNVAVGNAGGNYFATGRKCRHLGADLAEGSIDDDGCLVCPWHGATYDVTTGRMLKGPGGVFGMVPGLGAVFKARTRVQPLAVHPVIVKDGDLYLDD